MSSVFTKIIDGEIPCHKIAEDDQFFAFLDIRPVHEGHTLVVPKQEVDYLFDLGDDVLAGILTFAKPIAKALEQVVTCERVGVVVAGLEVPHAHVHLIPFSSMSELSFAHAKPADMDELAALGGRIRAAL